MYARAAAPCGCAAAGFPHAVRMTSVISASTSSAMRVEAALSRYMGAIDFGVYIHFPWCRKLCPYCDFAVEVGEPPHAAYADAIVAELASRAGETTGTLASVYFGGGTPSLWHPEQLARVLAAVVARYGRPREVTLEANPTDVDAPRLAAWHAAGVTRLSIGVQSHHADELVTLGRDHRFGDGPAAVSRALADARFEISVDHILGVPPHGRAIDPPATGHASIYELTIEDRTAFGQRVRDGRLVPLDEDELATRYVAAHDAMTAAGFEHYEISSYARPGKAPPCTTACTGPARRTSGSASARRRWRYIATAPAPARPTRAARRPTSPARRPRPRTSRPTRWRSIACGSACGRATACPRYRAIWGTGSSTTASPSASAAGSARLCVAF